MINTKAFNSEETTSYSIGYTIGVLSKLKRMVELNMDDIPLHKPNYKPFFPKSEVMGEFDKAINELSKITYQGG
jgi:hypothetical protein